jgi:RNA polymerase sigma-70 factor (ECF subfamily)
MADDVRPDIERARRGDRQAFGRLVRLYQRRVYITAFRMMRNHEDAHDVAQEAFIRAFRGIGSFDARSDFFTWLYRIVVNVSLNHMRRRRRRPAVPLEEAQLPEPLARQARGDPGRTLELKRKVRAVDEALDELPETLRTTVVLVILEGMSYKEAAEVLECSEGTVGWRIHEARQKLRDRLGHLLSSEAEEKEDELSGDTAEALDVP